MKHTTIAILCALSLATSAVFFSGCSGCSTGNKPRKNASPHDADTPAVARQTETGGGIPQGMTPLPAETELSPEAQSTYAYLIFAQAMNNEDENALDQARGMMRLAKLPIRSWLEGGVWLMSRNSSIVLPFLQDALAVWPDDISLNLLNAEALINNGAPHQGVDLMRAYLGKHPDSFDASLKLALLLVKIKEFAEAENLLKTIPHKKRSPLVNYYQARTLIGMQRQGEAIPYLQEAVKEQPDFVEALAELAFAYEQRSNLPEARKIYERLLKLNFSPQDVLLRLVNISLRLNQPERALRYMNLGPNAKQFRLAVAGMFMDSRHYLQAESLLKQIAAEGDQTGEVHIMLADMAYRQRRDLSMALSLLDNVLPTSSSAGQAQLLRTQLLADAGQEKAALESTRKGQRDFADIPVFWEIEIRLLARAKHMTEALDIARNAQKLWPDNMEFHFLLGSLLDETGDKKNAFEVIEKILETQPDNFHALNYVGYTLAEENRDLDRALKLLIRADEISPNQSYIVDSIAWALFKSGQAQEALAEIRRAVKLGEPPDPSIWEHYGDIAIYLNLKDEARKAYQNALDFKPANAESLRQRLSKL